MCETWANRWVTEIADLEIEVARLRAQLAKEEAFTMAAMDKAKVYRAALEKIADPSTSWGHMKLIARDVLAIVADFVIEALKEGQAGATPQD